NQAILMSDGRPLGECRLIWDGIQNQLNWLCLFVLVPLFAFLSAGDAAADLRQAMLATTFKADARSRLSQKGYTFDASGKIANGPRADLSEPIDFSSVLERDSLPKLFHLASGDCYTMNDGCLAMT
ncbi:MAG: hypothetical protein OXD48_04940, partial [Litoreibacter sp.]|nr:hypothetical protein [Litoreibacter sp.]